MSGWSASPPVIFVSKAKAAAKALASGGSRRSVMPSSSSSPLPLVQDSGRSRSPPRVALPGLRADAPGRLARRFVGLPRVLDEESRARALEELDRDILATTTNRTTAARLRTIQSALTLWGIPMWPPTPTSFKALAATLKMGRYSSAPIYLSAYRVEAERRGYVMDALATRSIKDYTRSCLRGLGEPSRPRPLPFERLFSLPGNREPWTSGGPVNPRAAILVGSWWLCREIELSGQRASLAEFSGSGSSLRVALHLPASKTDQQAVGCSRMLSCCCPLFPSGRDRAACPVHCMVDHVLYLRILFPRRWHGEHADVDLPLFPSASGQVVGKSAMHDTIVEAGRLLGLARSAPDGSERITGHSLRVTGAQGLVMRGWDLWTVQLHGRWGSDVIKRYARDSSLNAAALGLGPANRQGLDLEAVVAAVLSKIQPSERVRPASVQSAVCLRPAAGAPPLAEIAAQLESERHMQVEPEPCPARLVLNMRSGTYHRLVDASVSSAACGWSYRTNPHAMVPDVEAGPKSGIQLCSRCWPSLRAVALATGAVPLVPNQSSSSSAPVAVA